ncbi:MarR family winged helix-turn-helix transcriptional regulator [Stackebrandtia nassauensis]|uniref:Transcriptional regulator, MarR family n=1 Tax=Stackebrandtia nassauensis (strain DSM 44728 / CIP 108903 / NRRL B-16338 / NBRC 102104 / LLR-40K-21) TaxID=446470 RepID=D3Q262_STANL|nr:MarR family winged helix-turn-helix transcriptional regulator [Stackebrandtia nassauensis]ADD41929.1 transcriptional regulator, MarR family [Stackebrandtia nassauensis DSM 44728]
MTEHNALAFALLSAATDLVEGIDSRMRERGFTDVRPAHGYAFVRIAGSGATVTQVAEHLSMTKQAASLLVGELVDKGYVERRPHPDDARAKLLVLTDKGRACTRAADRAAAEVVGKWAEILGEERVTALRVDLGRIASRGRIRPVW